MPTQNLGFVNLLKGFTHKLNGWNVKLTPKAYKELQSYALGHFYNQCEFVQYPIDYSVDENGQMNVHLSENRTDGDFEAERQRIYGYNQNTSLTIRHRGIMTKVASVIANKDEIVMTTEVFLVISPPNFL